MGWKQEGREVMQGLYGGYCSLMKLMQLDSEIVPYHSFTIEKYNFTKEKWKKFKETKK